MKFSGGSLIRSEEVSVRNVVQIKKHNNAEVLVQTFPDIKKKISEHFKYRSDNYRFNPLFKRGLWDGFIRLYNQNTTRFPTGLVPRLIKFLKNEYNDIEITVESEIQPTMFRYRVDPEEYFSRANGRGLFKSLKLPSEYTLREEQIDGVIHAMRKERVLLLSPTSSGKSMTIFLILKAFLGRLPRPYPPMCGLIIVPRASLVEQLYSDFEEYSANINPKEFNIQKDVFRIHSEMEKIRSLRDKSTKSPIIISTWQSLHNIQDENYFKSFQLVIGDEAHTFKAKSLNEIMLYKLVNAEYRIGTTGTIDNEKISPMALEGLFGPIKTLTTTKKMIEKGYASKLQIKCFQLVYPKQERLQASEMDYPGEISFLCPHGPRNAFLTKLIRSLEGNSLVLFRLIGKHGRKLHKLLQKELPEKRLFFVTGALAVEERELIRNLTEKNSNVVILGSIGVFSMGVNIRNLQNLVFATPIKSRILNLQSIGRVLRKDGKKNECFVYDIGDDLRTKRHTNYAFKHFQKRLNIYEAEGFDYEIETVKLVA